MAREKIYSEEKNRFTMTLTPTGVEWLERMKKQMGANSRSDVIERLARSEEGMGELVILRRLRNLQLRWGAPTVEELLEYVLDVIEVTGKNPKELIELFSDSSAMRVEEGRDD